jgi:hypothetical protein
MFIHFVRDQRFLLKGSQRARLYSPKTDFKSYSYIEGQSVCDLLATARAGFGNEIVYPWLDKG